MYGFVKTFKAPFILSYGAFFLILVLWSVAITGGTHSDASYTHTYWHAHEIIYGVWALGMFGFIATAAPKWTGERVLASHLTFIAVVLWTTYRSSFFYISDDHQIYFSIICSVCWWCFSSFMIARLVVRPRHTRGIFILILYVFIATQDIVYLVLQAIDNSEKAAIVIKSTILFYTSLIGIVFSKIYPFFCMKALPSYEKNDMRFINTTTAVISVIGATLYLCSSVFTLPVAPGWVMILVGMLNWKRLHLWSDRSILRNAMLLFPFIAMLNIATGLVILGVTNILLPAYFTDVLHFIAIAGISLMFSTIMLRVYLGHTGNKIVANLWVKCSFALFVIAGLLRSLFTLSNYETHYLILSVFSLISASLIIQFQFIYISIKKV
ncbi:MAG: NnrS family protein [Alteromonadaceae bacterium]|nr:NnrS family protein [Alteromonadaceae bacterium]